MLVFFFEFYFNSFIIYLNIKLFIFFFLLMILNGKLVIDFIFVGFFFNYIWKIKLS